VWMKTDKCPLHVCRGSSADKAAPLEGAHGPDLQAARSPRTPCRAAPLEGALVAAALLAGPGKKNDAHPKRKRQANKRRPLRVVSSRATSALAYMLCFSGDKVDLHENVLEITPHRSTNGERLAEILLIRFIETSEVACEIL
jgi:hypothetical protein